jgi:hypothetical protein
MTFCNFFDDEFFVKPFPIALLQEFFYDTKLIANAPWFLNAICIEHECHTLTPRCFH